MQAPRPRNWNSSGTSPGGRITEKFGKDNSARAHDNGFRVQASRLSLVSVGELALCGSCKGSLKSARRQDGRYLSPLENPRLQLPLLEVALFICLASFAHVLSRSPKTRSTRRHAKPHKPWKLQSPTTAEHPQGGGKKRRHLKSEPPKLPQKVVLPGCQGRPRRLSSQPRTCHGVRRLGVVLGPWIPPVLYGLLSCGLSVSAGRFWTVERLVCALCLLAYRESLALFDLCMMSRPFSGLAFASSAFDSSVRPLDAALGLCSDCGPCFGKVLLSHLDSAGCHATVSRGTRGSRQTSIPNTEGSIGCIWRYVRSFQGRCQQDHYKLSETLKGAPTPEGFPNTRLESSVFVTAASPKLPNNSLQKLRAGHESSEMCIFPQ